MNDRVMTTPSLQAKVSLRGAWFAAHPNQPMPEGRAEVERLFAAIEAEARAAPDPAPLDVERLARALHDCRMVVVAHGKFTDKCICNDIARFIVREKRAAHGSRTGDAASGAVTPTPGRS